MKKVLLILLISLIAKVSFGQYDKNGNPIFNSIELGVENFENYSISSSYYTIENNIDNPVSSVFVSYNPTNEDFLEFARNLPSYFFIVHKGETVFAMIMLTQENEGSKTELKYFVKNPNTEKTLELPCNVKGEISEKRVEELEKLKVDSASKIIDFPYGKAYLFNGVVYRIQPYNSLKKEVYELASYLMNSQKKIEDPIKYIEKETIGGKLDFFKALEKENQTFYNLGSVIYNKKDFSILLWGQSVKKIGIGSEKKAIKLWEKIHKRKLSKPEMRALKNGYNAELED